MEEAKVEEEIYLCPSLIHSSDGCQCFGSVLTLCPRGDEDVTKGVIPPRLPWDLRTVFRTPVV